jgi:glycosyltransferase involved in cell wall biosynthesis
MAAVDKSLNILLLVDSLADPADPDPFFELKNIFIRQQVTAVSSLHRIFYPLLIPYLPAALKKIYSLRGTALHFPRARNGVLEGIDFRTLRYWYLPRYYPRTKYSALQRFLAQQSERYDLIHCHTVYDLGLAGLKLKEKTGLPLVLTLYGTDLNWLFEEGGRSASPEIAAATKKVLKGADAVIGVSRDLGEKLKKLGVEEDRIYWVPNGVDQKLYFPGNRIRERKSLGISEDQKIILYVGNLIETKGLGDLIKALEIILTGDIALPKFKLLLVGPGTGYKKTIEQLVCDCGLDEKVVFMGPRPHEEIPALMRAADVFCLPSWREGWPCSVVEAMACGVPVVATEVGGIPELVNDKETGILCPAKEPAGLARTLQEALTRKWDSNHISAAAEPYTYDKLALKIDGIYRQVLKTNSESKHPD